MRPPRTARAADGASVAFDGSVDTPDEHERREEADGAQHDEGSVRRKQHVAEEERGLQKAKHTRATEVVEEAVRVAAVGKRARGGGGITGLLSEYTNGCNSSTANVASCPCSSTGLCRRDRTKLQSGMRQF
eukprot:6205354-Pleurochrysis_carterae.AAC.1